MGGYRNADLYQMLAYAVALGLPGGVLFYAADEGVNAADHVVVHNGKRLSVVALDLTEPPRQILKRMAAIAAGIKPESHSKTVAS